MGGHYNSFKKVTSTETKACGYFFCFHYINMYTQAYIKVILSLKKLPRFQCYHITHIRFVFHSTYCGMGTAIEYLRSSILVFLTDYYPSVFSMKEYLGGICLVCMYLVLHGMFHRQVLYSLIQDGIARNATATAWIM